MEAHQTYPSQGAPHGYIDRHSNLTMSGHHLTTSLTETTIRNRNYESHKNLTELCADTNLKSCSRKIEFAVITLSKFTSKDKILRDREKKATQTDDLNQDNNRAKRKKLLKESENMHTHSFTYITESFCCTFKTQHCKLIMPQCKLIFKNTHRNYPCCFWQRALSTYS